MSGHTPGPWTILHGGFQHDDGFSIGSDNAAALRIGVVCECWPCTIVDNDHRKELLANASLIAAAPELLEALENFVESVEMVDPGVYVDAVDEARQAIAKAKGETQ